jgi:8-oxo-dGTP pyrophosphatase MutT (NUDIX family)
VSLVERLRDAFETGHRGEAVLLAGDNRDAVLGDQTIWVPAAVLVAVTDRADPGVILTRRTETLRKHAGQVAFPGGRIDQADRGPVEAALREAEEEIALPPSAVTVIGETDPYITITGFQVTPVVGVVPPDLPLRANDAEVAEVFEVPLSFLLEPANHLEQAVEWQGRERHYYEMMYGSHRIWGATAAMIVNLARRLQWP